MNSGGEPLRFGGDPIGVTGARGKEPPLALLRDFNHYLLTEWVDKHDVPTEGDALADFDSSAARTDYFALLAGGGRVHTEVGATTEQMWLGIQLIQREPLVLIANDDLFSGEPLARVTRKVLLPRALMADIVPRLFRVRLNRTDVEAQRRRWGGRLSPSYHIGVHDGQIGHDVMLIGMDRKDTGAFYHEPWPTGSFLEAGNNAAGVSATSVASDPGIFHVQLDQLMRVLCVLLLPVPTWNATFPDHAFTVAPVTQTERPMSGPPSNGAERTRRFLEHCRDHGLLDEQGIADMITLFDRNVLFERDEYGADVLDHLTEMATKPRAEGVDVRQLLSQVLRALADPHSMNQR